MVDGSMVGYDVGPGVGDMVGAHVPQKNGHRVSSSNRSHTELAVAPLFPTSFANVAQKSASCLP